MAVLQGDVRPPVVGDVHCVHRLAAGTELLGEYKDSAYQEPRYLARRADGQVMQLPGLLYRVACSLDGRDDEQVAADVNEALGQELTADQVSFLVEERLRPVGLIASEEAQPGTPDEAAAPAPAPVRSDPLLALRYRAGVIPAHVAWRISGFFGPFFARPAWITLLTGFVAVDVWIVTQGSVLGRMVAGVEDLARHPVRILAILGVGLVASAFHEFGHVTACRYGGARPGDIGVGLYLVWPALYSTVTDSYRLDRTGRLRTDLGGVYFNAVFLLGVGLVYVRTGEPWLLIALIGMHAQTVWQFLPSLRLDGYYILADLVGVPDLFGFVRPVLASLLPWRPTHPLMGQLKPRARRLVLLWVVLVVPALLFYFVAFLVAAPRLLPAAWHATLGYVQSVGAAARGGDVVAALLGVFQLLVLALPWVGMALILTSMLGILRRVVLARWGVREVSDIIGAALRRALRVAGPAVLGALLITRVASVAFSHSATAGEVRVTESAFAAVRGIGNAPTVGVGQWLARQQLVGYAELTAAFDRRLTVLDAGREVAVLATAVLVGCLLALLLVRRLQPLAVALPLAVTLAVGPAVTALATSWPAVLGAAWTAVGVLFLAHAPHRGVRVLGVLAVVLGLGTEPMLAVPFAAGIAAMLGQDQLGSGRPPWWPAQLPPASGGPRHEEGARAVPALVPGTGPRHGAATTRAGGAEPSLWLSIALLVPFGAFGAALAWDGGDTVLDGAERTVLLLIAGLVTGLGLVMRRLRPPALAAASLVGLAALPWSGAGAALALTVLVGLALAALLTEVLVRRTAEDRPHPLLRLVVAVPAVVVTLVGALFLPITAPLLAHRQLAEWVIGSSSAGGIVAVPEDLWGDLLRDDVPADRLVLTTTPGAFSRATWKAEVGNAAPGARSVAEFGSGPSSVTVVPLPSAGFQARAAAADLRATEAETRAAQAEGRAVAADLATRQRFGTLLAASPRLQAPTDVLTALRDGSVDGRVLVVLAGLTADHRIQLGPLSEVNGEGPDVPRHRILINGCDCSLTTLTAWLRAQPLPFAPAAIESGDGALTTAW